VSSAGLLRGGAVAWVEVSVPDNIATPEGVEFRPNLLATTSFDGSIATTFKRTVTDVVCDKTRELALAERGQQVKIKHSRQSQAKLAPAREALAIVHSLGDEFAAEVAALCAIAVTDEQWKEFLDHHVPVPTDTSAGRARTLADTKRQQLTELYTDDPWVAPWAGTAHGVLQAVNTYEHHLSTVRGFTRSERNMLRTVTGDFGKLDRSTLATLRTVLT
jgi:phage/plasmid-like protein (TIGR03299 family)